MALYVVITTVALLAGAGLVIDGGTALAARGRAIGDAYAAARAGAEALDQSAFATAGTVTDDPAAAAAAAHQALAVDGDDAGAEVSVDGRVVTVRVTITAPTNLLGVVGIDTLTVHGEGSARAVYGVTGAQP